MPKSCIANAWPHRRPRALGWLALWLSTLAGVVVLDRPPAIAQPANRATLTQLLDGSDVFIQNRKAKVNDSASQGQRVRTGATRAELKFNTGAVGRLGHNSTLTVGQCARLKRGTLLINGALNGCSGSAVAGVRGTTYLMEVDDAGQTRVTVLEGKVTVTPANPVETEESADPANRDPANRDQAKQFKLPVPVRLPRSQPPAVSGPPQQPCADCAPAQKSPAELGEAGAGNDQAVPVATGETVVVTTTGKVGTVVKLSETEYRRILTGALFDGYAVPIPGIDKVQGAYRQLFPGFPFPRPNVNLRIAPPVRIRSPF